MFDYFLLSSNKIISFIGLLFLMAHLFYFHPITLFIWKIECQFGDSNEQNLDENSRSGTWIKRLSRQFPLLNFEGRRMFNVFMIQEQPLKENSLSYEANEKFVDYTKHALKKNSRAQRYLLFKSDLTTSRWTWSRRHEWNAHNRNR